MINAKILADSINPDGQRLTTLELTYPRFIHSEIMTHRVMSRNAASSRAIPIKKMRAAIKDSPATPISWGKNQAGMQANRELTGWRRALARRLFLFARWPTLLIVWFLSKIGLHKQVANRLLEPWMHMTTIVSATEWENFFTLRCHKDAQPEFRELALQIREAMAGSTPQPLQWGQWHLPLAPQRFLDPNAAKVSAACCARVSYVRQHDQKSDEEDIAFTDKLAANGHLSPLEHPAMAAKGPHGNFCGFKQLRKFYPNESGSSSSLDASDNQRNDAAAHISQHSP